ncbi:MAG: MBL fold metallo-hydrolase [Nitriliruptorales bacterium]
MDEQARVEVLSGDVIAIDTLTAGMTRMTAGYLLPAPRPALIECGPSLASGNVITGLREVGLEPEDLAYLVLTHIHLDHAGGAGDIAAVFPSATIVVSAVGAPHLQNPERLNASSRRVYGELMDTVYGECTPVEGERLLAAEDGHRIDLGGGRRLQLLSTPGHAKHHMGIWDEATGTIFSGDSVGVKLPGMRDLRPATPPPDFHLEAAKRSLGRYLELQPARVYLAHYGEIGPPSETLERALERLHLWAEAAEAAYREHDELDHVVETLGQRFADEFDPALIPDDPHGRERVRLMSGVRANAAGLLRYLRKRDAGELEAQG